MKSYDGDELEQALFAMPLEEPPADLRSAILARTIYAAPLPVKPWEIWALGIVLALFAWLLVLMACGEAAPTIATFNGYGRSALEFFAQPQILLWIAVGGGAAVWISQLNLTFVPEALRATRR